MKRHVLLALSIAFSIVEQSSARAQSTLEPELACFDGPKFFENSYFNWRFVNNCPFDVTVRYQKDDDVTNVHTGPSAKFSVAACKARTMQGSKQAKVQWFEATATATDGICVNGRAVKADSQSGANSAPGKPPPPAERVPDFSKLIAEQGSRSLADMLATQEAEHDAAKRASEAEREAEREAESRAREAREAREAQEKREADEPKPASGFDVGKCDKVVYDDDYTDGKTVLLCWRKGYEIANPNPGAQCDKGGVMYNGVLALYCALGDDR